MREMTLDDLFAAAADLANEEEVKRGCVDVKAKWDHDRPYTNADKRRTKSNGWTHR